MTFEDLQQEASNRVTFGDPRRVKSVQCPTCGKHHPGVMQYRWGQYARFIDLDNGNVKPLWQCCK